MSYFGMQGLGAVGCCAGFGAIDFNGPSVAADWLAGGSRAAVAAKMIQAGLNQIGYGPLTVDGQFGAGSLSAWKRFASDNGVNASWPDQAGILKLGEQVAAGGNQGGGPLVESHISGGQFVPGAAPGATPIGKASLSTGAMIGIGALAVAGVAFLAVAAKKKKTAVANRRRRHRRAA